MDVAQSSQELSVRNQMRKARYHWRCPVAMPTGMTQMVTVRVTTAEGDVQNASFDYLRDSPPPRKKTDCQQINPGK